jgi:hypothetical protein
MSYRLSRVLQSVREEYGAAKAALAFTARKWPASHAEPELLGESFDSLRLAIGNVEATYTLRLFAEFEALLREQYPHSRPGRRVPMKSDALIDGLGGHYRIPAAERERVHQLREFRHTVAHAAPAAQRIPFVDALQWLNRFLARIRDEDVP